MKIRNTEKLTVWIVRMCIGGVIFAFGSCNRNGDDDLLHFDNWREVYGPSDILGLNGLSVFIANNRVWVAGETPDSFFFAYDAAIALWDRSSSAWGTTSVFRVGGGVNCVFFTVVGEGWAVGRYKDSVGYWRRSGTEWNFTSLNIPEPSSVYFTSPATGWMITYKDYETAQAYILYFSGSSWEIVDTVGWNLKDIDFVSSNSGWIVGDGGIIHYDGNSWSVVDTVRTGCAIESISDQDIWIAKGNSLYHWDGSTWNENNIPACDVQFVSPEEGWAVGATGIWHYLGGEWILVSPPEEALNLTAVHFVDSTYGWAVGKKFFVYER
jgi:hypothetical protein